MSLRIEIYAPPTARTPGTCHLRAVLFNDGYEPVSVSRNAFVGPSVVDTPSGTTRPQSVEPTFGGPEEPLTLQPFSFYGRERTFADLAAGETTVVARYRPVDGGGELSASQPLTVEGPA